MFRDSKFANRMKSEAQEKDRQERLRLERERLERQRKEEARRAEMHAKANRRTFPVNEEEDARLVKSLRPGLFSRLFGRERQQPENIFQHYERKAMRTKILMALGVVGLLTLMGGFMYYQYEYGLREGYVTGRDYRPGYWTSSRSCDSHGHCTSSSTYHPPEWSVEITYDDTSTTWSVSESVYEDLHHGEWFCVGGISYRCQGEPSRGVTHPSAEHFTLAGEEQGL